ncbi:hypothetical protein P4S75_03610 [Anoxybacillus ayderensis]|uniref:hypothetical protein n=1 Tax=Anoxybacillus ayderensis TaxID=265546 RepID=UPI002E1A508A|nr:hypothetical protein [Anoxybacillus ayderensis]
MSKLHIVIPVVEHEVINFSDNLKILLENIEQSNMNQRNVQIHVILQSKNPQVPVEIKKYEQLDNIKIHMVNFFSVSKARNYGIELIPKNKNNFIYLLDNDAIPGISFFNMVNTCIAEDFPISTGRIIWEINNVKLIKKVTGKEHIHKKKSVYKNNNYFLGTYIIRGDLLENVRFNEKIGPANNTRIKAGEDVLFFYDLFSKNNIKFIHVFDNSYVFHPPRPKDMSKQLLYAEGQGALYRHLLFSKKLTKLQRIGLIINFILFIGNSFFRVILCKPKSIPILRKRFNGFFNSDFQKYYK